MIEIWLPSEDTLSRGCSTRPRRKGIKLTLNILGPIEYEVSRSIKMSLMHLSGKTVNAGLVVEMVWKVQVNLKFC
jgi:hypothetical protein